MTAKKRAPPLHVGTLGHECKAIRTPFHTVKVTTTTGDDGNLTAKGGNGFLFLFFTFFYFFKSCFSFLCATNLDGK